MREQLAIDLFPLQHVLDGVIGGHVRLVVDPIGISVPIPHLGLIPLYYEQFRSMIGIQVGA